MSWLKDEAGFSFVELMVVIAIIGALSAVAVPSFLHSLPEKRLKAASRNLYADMQRARLRAIRMNKKIRAMFVKSVNPGYYYFDENANSKFDAGEFKRNLSDYSGVDYGRGKVLKRWDGETFTSLATNISFMAEGTSNQGTTYLHNQNKDVCYAVTTTRYGTITIRRFNGKDWDEKR